MSHNEILKKILEVDNTQLNSLNINLRFNELLNHDSSYQFMELESGKEHYRLLSYISTLYDNDILFDVGTNACRSAISLSYNKNNKIKSYDIIQVLEKNPIVSNIEFILGDSTKDEQIQNSPFIFLDVDHDGVYENIFYTYLKNINWNGLLVLDDIYLNEEMKNFWNNISEQKYDLTNKGHWSGTGLVLFK